MNRWLIPTILIFLSPLAWGQNPGPGPGPNPPDLTAQGFTDAEAKAAQADLKSWEQANREWDADLQVIEAQLNRLMVREALDRGELEKTFRSQYDLLLKRDLARVDLQVKWRKAYGMDRSRMLEGRLGMADPSNPKKPRNPKNGEDPGFPGPDQPQGPGPDNGPNPGPGPKAKKP